MQLYVDMIHKLYINMVYEYTNMNVQILLNLTW
jgi:hypothetical protein